MTRKEIDERLREYAGDDPMKIVAYVRSVVLDDEEAYLLLQDLERATKAREQAARMRFETKGEFETSNEPAPEPKWVKELKSVKQYSHMGVHGLVQRRKSRASGTMISVYRADQAGLDPNGGQWVTVCEEHGSLCNHETLKLARAHSTAPEWCEDCQPKVNAD